MNNRRLKGFGELGSLLGIDERPRQTSLSLSEAATVARVDRTNALERPGKPRRSVNATELGRRLDRTHGLLEALAEYIGPRLDCQMEPTPPDGLELALWMLGERAVAHCALSPFLDTIFNDKENSRRDADQRLKDRNRPAPA